jgi:hypothetical protein
MIILFAGHVMLQSKFKKRIQYNTGPARDCGVFILPERGFGEIIRIYGMKVSSIIEPY